MRLDYEAAEKAYQSALAEREKVRTYVQDLTVDHVAGGWKVADMSTTVVRSFEGQPCAA